MKFEHLGWFEEIIDVNRNICVGTRPVQSRGGRELGWNGREMHTFREPFKVVKGHRTVTVRASYHHPVVAVTMLHECCGRADYAHPQEKR